MSQNATEIPAASPSAFVAACDACGAHREVDGLAPLVAAGWKALDDGRVFCPACADPKRRELAP